MCLAFWAAHLQPEYPLVLLFNRDEDFERISAPIHFWVTHPDVVGGFDVSTGGTWAGVRRDGRYAMLTFVREPRLLVTPVKRRGQIVRDYLLADMPASEFASRLASEPNSYLGYNVILGDRNGAVHYNNRSGSSLALSRGLYGVSNADLETPWFKVLRGKQAIAGALAAPWHGIEPFWQILEDRCLAADECVQDTGLRFDRERTKSSIFVCEPDYGTRSSSIVLFHRSGSIEFTERTYRTGAERTAEVTIRM